MRPIVDLYKSDGTKQTPTANVFTLADATTYYAELTEFVDARSGFSLHYKYNAALVAAITVEASNRDRTDVTSVAAVGSGWATTTATTVSPAASAGETVAHYADMMAARTRIKIVVTTGGTLRIDEHSKGNF
jgi:hypothetical protein